MFAYRLALALGYPHPDYLLDTLTARQFAGWREFYSVEPFGSERGDIQAGVIASTLANIHRDPKKGRQFSIQDFMPFRKPERLSDRIRKVMRSKRKDGS